MSVTYRYTQSQTRLQNSATELNVATAHWRRIAANAHLAATYTNLAHLQADAAKAFNPTARSASRPTGVPNLYDIPFPVNFTARAVLPFAYLPVCGLAMRG